MFSISSSPEYNYVNDLCVLTSYYNPNNYKTKYLNYQLFLEKIQQAGLNYKVIECAFNNEPYTLPYDSNVVRVRSKHVMWQKERLLNHLLKFVPKKCTKIAWIDADILFVNPNWAIETSNLLNIYNIVQPYHIAIRLPRNAIVYNGEGDCYYSFGYIYKHKPNILLKGKFDEHGHTGFAWAARKEILLNYGLYDACIAGSGDHMMAHSFCGDWETICIKRIIGNNEYFYRHYCDWSKQIYSATKAKVSYTPGTILHLWHGEVSDRRYVDRQRVLSQFMYCPSKDLKINNYGCWEWQTDKAELIEWANNYFSLRKEDG